jgi:hypothetical protein
MNWLKDLTPEKIKNQAFPLEAALQNSFFYPSSCFDGGVVKDCNKHGKDLAINSFIFCDYAVGQAAFLQNQASFIGYRVLANRNIAPTELIPNGWNPSLPPRFNKSNYMHYRSEWQQFMHWTVYEREESRTEDHGPERFSLLYLGGEGVATYQALYWSNRAKPKALAIIQPGTGFGLNWTDFKDKDAAFAWVVNQNPTGTPDLIYYGGIGSNYTNLDWNDYQECRTISSYYSRNRGEVRIYQKTQEAE